MCWPFFKNKQQIKIIYRDCPCIVCPCNCCEVCHYTRCPCFDSDTETKQYEYGIDQYQHF